MLWPLATVLLPALFIMALSRPTADDFVFANMVNEHGWLGAQAEWYETWTGRFVSTAVLSLLNGDVDISRTYGSILVGLFVFSVAAIFAFTRALIGHFVSSGVVVSTGLLLTALYVSHAPVPGETFFWLPGAATYQLGSAFLLFGVAAILAESGAVAARRSRVLRFAAASCVVLAVGSSETTMVLSWVVLVGLAGAFLWSGRRWRPLLPVGAACLVASAVVVAAPGNALRQDLFSRGGDLATAAAVLVEMTVRYGRRWLFDGSVLLGVLSLLLLVSNLSVKEWLTRPKWILGILGTALGVLVAAILPAAWATGLAPPSRVFNATLLFFLVALMVGVVTVVRQEDEVDSGPIRGVPLVLLGLFCASLVLSSGSISLVRSAAVMPEYSNEMARRFEVLRQRGTSGGRVGLVTLPALSSRPEALEIEDLKTDPGFWVNQEVAEFFGVPAVAVRPDGGQE